MATYLASAVLLGSLCVAQGGDPTPRPPAVAHADALPPDTELVLAVRADAQTRVALLETPLSGLLERAVASGPGAQAAGLVRTLLGEDAEDWIGAVLEQGVTVGVSGLSSGQPDWVAIVGVGTRRAEIASLLREHGDPGDAGIAEHLDAETLTLAGVSAPLWCAIVGERVVVTATPRSLQAAVERLVGERTDRLGKRFHDFATRTLRENASGNVAFAWLDAQRLLAAGLARLPDDVRRQVRPWTGRLGLDALSAVAWSFAVHGSGVRERVVVALPAPRPALLRALLPDTGRPGSGIAALLPSNSTSCQVARLRVHEVFEQVLSGLEDVDPRLPKRVRGFLGMMREQTGVDLETQVIAALGTHFANASWPRTDGRSETGFVVELDDSEKFAAAVSRLAGPPRARIDAFDLFLPGAPGMGAIAIGPGHLLVTTTEDGMRAWIAGLRINTAPQELTELLASAPEGTVSLGWTNPGADLRAALESMPGLPGEPSMTTMLPMVEAAMDALGVLRYRVTANASGYVLQADSASGSVGALLAAALHADPELLTTIRPTGGDPRSTAASEVARRHLLLERIGGAQAAYRESHGGYGTLGDLIAAGELSEDVLGAPAGAATWRNGSDLVAMLLPEGGTPAEHFVAVVWPADERPGSVYARSDRHTAMSNALVAQQRGLRRVLARDVYVNGDFDARLVAGWRPLGSGALPADAAMLTAAAAELAVVVALEKDGAAPEAFVQHLESEHPKVVARAAWNLGKEQHAPAAGELAMLATTHDDTEVRRHAMAALRAIGAPTTGAAAATALGDDDEVVRAQAAALLGALRDRSGSDSLLEALTRSNPGGTDRRAALLALTDLGDPEVLLRAAQAVRAADAEDGEALAFLFQELSPRLGDGESRTLMAVLDHPALLLRRYAIQRLGELADPDATTALEARLASEGDALRPLVQVALDATRRANTLAMPRAAPESEGGGQSFRLDLSALPPWALPAACGGLAALLAIVFLLRRRHRMTGDDWAEMVHPSDEYAAQSAVVEDGEVPEEWAEDVPYDAAPEDDWQDLPEDDDFVDADAEWDEEPAEVDDGR